MICLILLLILIGLIVYRVKLNLNYWDHNKIPNIPAVPFLGNLTDVVLFKRSITDVFNDFYNSTRFKKNSFIGFHIFHKPTLFIRDPELIKKFTISDFNSFCDRAIDSNEKADSLGSHTLFILKNPLWREMRQKVTPFFSTGHMKQMFQLFTNIGNELDKHLQSIVPEHGKYQMEAKDMCVRYTLEIIASCAFGIRANCLIDFNSEFGKFSRKLIHFNLYRAIEFTSIYFLPKFAKLCRFKFFTGETSEFIRKTIKDVMKERQRSGTLRHDLIDTLIEIKKSNDGVKFDDDILIAQAASFFAGGFETPSTVLSFAMFELAKNQEIQSRLREEINLVLNRNKGILNYENIHEMIYLDMFIKESLRMYPSLPFIERKCTNQNGYFMENCNYTIPAGMQIIIPIYSIHRDAKYFENPDNFDPERFSLENKSKILPYTYMPFGIGGRNCLAERFGILQVKVGVVSFLRNHILELDDNQPHLIKLEPKALMLQSVGGIRLTIRRDN